MANVNLFFIVLQNDLDFLLTAKKPLRLSGVFRILVRGTKVRKEEGGNIVFFFFFGFLRGLRSPNIVEVFYIIGKIF